MLEYAEWCTKCTYCLECDQSHYPKCPSSNHFASRAYRPPGRMDLVREYASDRVETGLKLDLSTLVDRFYACTLCGACDAVCNTLTGKRPLDVFKAMRVELVRQRVGPPLAHKTLFENVSTYGNPQGAPNTRKMERFTESKSFNKVVSKSAPTLYFRGCVASLSSNLPMQVASMIKILGTSNTKIRVLEDEPCCGHVLINTGQENYAIDNARKTLKMVNSLGVKKVLFTCPACRKAFKDEYPRLLGVEPDFECLSAAEYVSDLIDKGKLVFKKSGKTKKTVVTYHDPCHLGRHAKIFDPPRNILLSLPGLTFAEMVRNRENSWCCGTGGGVKTAFPEFALNTALERLREAASTRATILTSACPACESGFIDALMKMPENERLIEVLDLVELVASQLA